MQSYDNITPAGPAAWEVLRADAAWERGHKHLRTFIYTDLEIHEK